MIGQSILWGLFKSIVIVQNEGCEKIKEQIPLVLFSESNESSKVVGGYGVNKGPLHGGHGWRIKGWVSFTRSLVYKGPMGGTAARLS